ncbi:hypothetical protein SAMN05216496_4318 [Pseudomonas sp. Z003-0.4C(8344-21)]|uniref:hypothetical protein n=1 Tax=Pseudomonas sp. Z003-0.4C(8344-21) TaxID=1855380 RepID=UPI00087C4831|nr:hypothetical protein [Pseudomonas sp. Z003-0.4C(8344-21)]SDT37711.1 hypothetical protein SAMN05216496_4318 [Pseudomonas sp. Z003-0.4C(8344-21)]
MNNDSSTSKTSIPLAITRVTDPYGNLVLPGGDLYRSTGGVATFEGTCAPLDTVRVVSLGQRDGATTMRYQVPRFVTHWYVEVQLQTEKSYDHFARDESSGAETDNYPLHWKWGEPPNK